LSARRFITLRTVIGVLCAAGLLTGTVLTGMFVARQRYRVANGRIRAQAHADSAAASIDAILAGVRLAATSIADSLSDGTLPVTRVEQSLSASLTRNAHVSGMLALFAPYAHSRDVRLYAPYYVKNANGDVDSVRVDALYDYTAFKYSWYTDPMLEGAMWTDPFVLAASTPRAGYAAPFYKPGANRAVDTPLGLIQARLSVEDVRATIDKLGLGQEGYAYVFAADGRYVSHPRADLVAQQRTIFETAFERSDTALNSIAVRAIKGQRGFAEDVDPATGQLSWVFYEPLPAARWTLAAVFFRDQFRANPDVQRRALAVIVLVYLFGALALTTLLVLLRLDRLTERDDELAPVIGARPSGQMARVSTALRLASNRLTGSVPGLRLSAIEALWLGSFLTGLLCAAGIAALWVVSNQYPSDITPNRISITDATSLARFEGAQDDSAAVSLDRSIRGTVEGSGANPPVYIRTGVFLKSVEFLSSYDVKVTGNIWQRYERGTDDSVTRGFDLPEASELVVSNAFHETQGSTEVVGWSFVATLRQDFGYEQYPFDRQELWLRLRHPQFRRNVLLVPDLDSYRLIDPVTRPGVEQALVLPGWSVLGSYFDYRLQHYNTNFGVEGMHSSEGMYELFFNVALKRDFLEPFVSKVIPLLVVAVLLFAILYVGTGREGQRHLRGFSAMEAIGGCAALFFAITFNHIELRQALQSQGIMYFEYFYFTTYVAVVAVSLNAIALGTGAGLRVVARDDNLIPKLAFWPAYVGALLLITLWFFY
jgi:hypothetical protein